MILLESESPRGDHEFLREFGKLGIYLLPEQLWSCSSPRSGARVKPTAQAVGKSGKRTSLGGAKEEFSYV